MRNGDGEDPVFDFEKLEVYRVAEDFVLWTEPHVSRLLRRRAHITDQLHRAATSIAFNIGEGGGEYSPAEKAHFYRIARRSATECASIVGILMRMGDVEHASGREGRALLHRIVSMLVVMCRTNDERARKKRRRE